MRWIYLHGFASSPASRKAQYFRARFQALGVDLRIPDLNGDNFENLSLTNQLARVREEAGTDRVVLIGSSMGGYLAALYAARNPQVDRIVIMAPAFDFVRRWTERLGDDEMHQWRKSGWLQVYHYGHDREQRVGWNLMEDAAKYEAFPEVSQPALVLHGSHDDVVPASASEQFAALGTSRTLRLYPSGHELTDVLDPIWMEMKDFLTLLPA